MEDQDIREKFLLALNQTLDSLGQDLRLQVSSFLLELSSKYSPYLIVSPYGILNLQERIFTDSVLRDFMLNLSFHFYFRLGVSESNRENELLCYRLAFAATSFSEKDLEKETKDENSPKTIFIPEEYKARLPNTNEVYSMLLINKWLAIALLITLYINVTEFINYTKDAES